MQPNTTQVPNKILDETMPTLSDVELRVILVITRQTLGWIEDKETGKRKDRDWISRYQLEKKTGRGHTAVSKAVNTLVDLDLIEALKENGELLDTAHKRQLHGSKIFYRLKTTQPSLFDKTSPKSGQVGGVATFQPPQKAVTTKETSSTKGNTNTLQPDKPVAPEVKKTPSIHRQLVEYFFETVKVARQIKPVITGKDGSNLKRIIELGITQSTIEQIACFYLYDPSFSKFSPTISTMLSSGILNGILNRMRNEPEFWKKLDGYAMRRGLNVPKTVGSSLHQAELRKQMAEIAAKFSMGEKSTDRQLAAV